MFPGSTAWSSPSRNSRRFLALPAPRVLLVVQVQLVSKVVQEKMAFLAKMGHAALPVPEDQVVVVTAKTGFPAATV